MLAGGWEDWSDGRERVGSAVLLQQLRGRGWGDADTLDDGLDGYRQFVVDHVVRPGRHGVDDRADRPGRPGCTTSPGSRASCSTPGIRIWPAKVMARFYALGGEHFLAFELGGVVGDLADALITAGRRGRGRRADRAAAGSRPAVYLAYGEDLPAHEVNYEQTIVAPLLDLLLAAHRRDPSRSRPRSCVVGCVG